MERISLEISNGRLVQHEMEDRSTGQKNEDMYCSVGTVLNDSVKSNTKVDILASNSGVIL